MADMRYHDSRDGRAADKVWYMYAIIKFYLYRSNIAIAIKISTPSVQDRILISCRGVGISNRVAYSAKFVWNSHSLHGWLWSYLTQGGMDLIGIAGYIVTLNANYILPLNDEKFLVVFCPQIRLSIFTTSNVDLLGLKN